MNESVLEKRTVKEDSDDEKDRTNIDNLRRKPATV